MVKTYEKPLFYGHKILLLIALEFVLAFSGLGYFIHYGSATIMYIPVIAGAYFYGIKAGVLLGAVFGITSIWKASMAGVSSFDLMFSPFFQHQYCRQFIYCSWRKNTFWFCSRCSFCSF